MICWYCYWGWPKPIASIYQEALKRLNGDIYPLHFGPSHIVWEDENFDCAEWCLENTFDQDYEYTQEQLDIVQWSLEELVKLPLGDKEIIPEGYDGFHPELYPPKTETVKI